jgi:hypothetical protein
VSNRVLTGSSLVLVTGVQARNNARVLFLGSLYMLSNEAFGEAGSNNKYFANAVTRWALQESGVLRATVREVPAHVAFRGWGGGEAGIGDARWLSPWVLGMHPELGGLAGSSVSRSRSCACGPWGVYGGVWGQ